MRIISGSHKGRRFTPPKGLPVRPTTDFAKEGLFNILHNHKNLEGCKVLDLCAGTGNMTFEFASRGAESVLSVDQHGGCIKYINRVARDFNFKGITAIHSELFKFIKKLNARFDIIFADPPYGIEGTDKLPDLILQKEILAEQGLFILEHGQDFSFEDHSRFLFSRKYGNVNFTFFE